MNQLKTFLNISAMVIFGIWLSGCVGKPITFKSVDPKSYEDVKDKGRTITGKSSGFQLLWLIPAGINGRHESAYDELMEEAKGDYVTDITIQESWSYAFIGTVYTTTITATAYPKK
ncbi:MAG: hypothetical protein PHW18_12895 [Sulfuricurvum sp.]|uniref:hypothetical protein n=1 Tax=Sulfuricurvum sp. TaxID=2025608 RepID=UPI00260F8194|nr:hypothetical protein [Sulfuricurvum sp.]MDD2830464.1 hypothetical protein [Sulfuricurvum sp.]MDD4948371.1 hypothetical protein [Sulfuricurvum sp.]